MRRADRELRDVRDCPMLETLEPRLVLAGSPLPEVGDLLDPTNSVVRFETPAGDIDLELFDALAPVTVENFKTYVRDGDYDSSIFHRLVSGFVLQGGGFRFVGEDSNRDSVLDGETDVPTDAPIVNEFSSSRSNIERTIAMAKLGGDPDSATSQWFINLDDNSANLDNQNGGFTVFGRVLNDDSWTVVQTLAAYGTENVGLANGALSQVPVAPGSGQIYNGDTLAFINDAEIIKDGPADVFYTETVYYAEGFSGSTINEFLPIGNPNSETVFFQVIARSEVSQPDPDDGSDFWFRDRVISTGSIAALTRGGITISQFTPGTGAPGVNDLLPQGVPYALEVRSTLPISANLSHFDFGSATGETFTGVLDTNWAFGEARKDTSGGRFEFVVWQNPNPDPVTLDLTFYVDGESAQTFQFTTEGYRRGGLAFNDFASIADGSTFALEISATDNILAALTRFDQTQASPQGSSSPGIPGDASIRGVLPMASIGDDADHVISVINPGNTVAVVRFTLEFDDARSSRTATPLIIPPRMRQTFDLATVSGLQNPDAFTVLYDSNAEIYAASLHTDRFVVNGDAISDTTGTPVAITGATEILFAEGFIDPARAGNDIFETITIYNPNTTFFGTTNQTVTVDVNIYYTDGFVLTESLSIDANERVDLEMHNLASVLSQGTDNGRFFFSIEIVASLPVVAQMVHYDLTLGALQPSGGFATLGTPAAGEIRLTDLGGGGLMP